VLIFELRHVLELALLHGEDGILAPPDRLLQLVDLRLQLLNLRPLAQHVLLVLRPARHHLHLLQVHEVGLFLLALFDLTHDIFDFNLSLCLFRNQQVLLTF